MSCIKCKSERIVEIVAKCNDLCHITENHTGLKHEGYNIYGSGGDYLEINLCLQCGQIQDNFPMEDLNIEGEND